MIEWKGLGCDRPLERAPLETDEERAAFLAVIRADLLRRGYLRLDRQQREEEEG